MTDAAGSSGALPVTPSRESHHKVYDNFVSVTARVRDLEAENTQLRREHDTSQRDMRALKTYLGISLYDALLREQKAREVSQKGKGKRAHDHLPSKKYIAG